MHASSHMPCCAPACRARLLLVAAATHLSCRATYHRLATPSMLQLAAAGRQRRMQQTRSSAGCTGMQRCGPCSGSSTRVHNGGAAATRSRQKMALAPLIHGRFSVAVLCCMRLQTSLADRLHVFGGLAHAFSNLLSCWFCCYSMPTGLFANKLASPAHLSACAAAVAGSTWSKSGAAGSSSCSTPWRSSRPRCRASSSSACGRCSSSWMRRRGTCCRGCGRSWRWGKARRWCLQDVGSVLVHAVLQAAVVLSQMSMKLQFC